MGNDVLIGGWGRDILVGGAGSDYLFGSFGQDILVAGTTSADLLAVQDVWTSSQSYWDRVAQLRDDISSEDDGSVDYLFGGFGRDWFLLDALDLAIDRFYLEALN
jgi:Ca2+-binding RTX toxin-like protein